MPAAAVESEPHSTSSSKPSLIKSHDGKKLPGLLPKDSAIASPVVGSKSSHLRPVEKLSAKERLTHMFSSKEVLENGGSSREQGAGPPRGSSPTSIKEPTSDRASDKPPLYRSQAVPGRELGQRFVSNPDAQGGHEHYLKSHCQQEMLSEIWRSLLGKKHQVAPENDLSLASSWIDSLRREKDDLASDKTGSNASLTLVEKYGKCQEVVALGAFGSVCVSHKKLRGSGEKLFAVKKFRRRPEETENYSKRLTAEFCVTSTLRHPNVIHTLDLLKDSKGDYCEIMELCAGGNLYALILSSGTLEVQEADCFFKQMMRGIDYIHEMGVAHRNLKPESLLLTTQGALKVADFGNGECFRMAWETGVHMVSVLCGLAEYVSPEEYTDKEFDARAVDVWACGVIYMAMRTGGHLWPVAKDDDEFYALYLQGRRDEEGYGPIESLHRARCRNVIYAVLDPHPTRRLTAAQVLKSEWFREIKLCKAGDEGL